ncbi:MAG: hypothetical protein NC452_18520 [Eubacterium sp.]|nr:hypothetical protein [Eubacterium sp.]
MEKAINDATQQKAGDIYQYLTALRDCFALNEGDTLYIEKHGDISIINDKGGRFQKEVKHHFLNCNLTGTSQRYGNFARNLMRKNGLGVELWNTEKTIPAYKEKFNGLMNELITRDMYMLFNILNSENDSDTDSIINIFRDDETLSIAANVFTQFVFEQITDFSDFFMYGT